MSIKFPSRVSGTVDGSTTTHLLRVLSPSGIYPDKTIATTDSLLYISRSICFSVVKYNPTERASADYYSEVDWLTFNEIRLYSSVLLSTDREVSYVAFYPLRYPSPIALSELLTSKRTQRKLREWIIEHARKPSMHLSFGRGTEPPPVLGGHAYELRSEYRDKALQKRLWKQIDVRDSLMMRGLSTLLRSIMLSQHFQFIEEAIHAVFISMDASFSLVRRKLSARGLKNVSSVDAAKYIATIFYEEVVEMRYFEEFYDNRVMSIHPESRFGTCAHAPLMVDDFFHLRDSMISIYAYFNSGHVNGEIISFATSRSRLPEWHMYGQTMRYRYARATKFARTKIHQSPPLYSSGYVTEFD